mmetsp:Transcript_11468/g.24573  ORF Transcript_11468/g.24573 Transcript_11468/m.24573 type:complete len:222 (-) Transcript_11468:761-1426(-)
MPHRPPRERAGIRRIMPLSNRLAMPMANQCGNPNSPAPLAMSLLLNRSSSSSSRKLMLDNRLRSPNSMPLEGSHQGSRSPDMHRCPATRRKRPKELLAVLLWRSLRSRQRRSTAPITLACSARPLSRPLTPRLELSPPRAWPRPPRPRRTVAGAAMLSTRTSRRVTAPCRGNLSLPSQQWALPLRAVATVPPIARAPLRAARTPRPQRSRPPHLQAAARHR